MILSGISGPLPLLGEEDEGTAGGPSLPPTSEKQRRMFKAHNFLASFEFLTQ